MAATSPADLPVPIDRLRSEIEAATDPEALRELRAKATAVERYLRSQLEPNAAELRRLTELHRRIERRLGEMLRTAVSRGGSKSRDSTLKSIGITKDQSAKWQRLAALPEPDFERFLAEAPSPSLNAALRYALEREAAAAEPRTATCKDLDALVERGLRFRTVYADPPWPYDNQRTRAATGNHYVTMSVDDICALPVEKIAAENAQLHLWTTNGFLEESFRVIRAWGFTFKSLLVWSKPHIGLGNYWRVSHELLLTATRGELGFRDAPERHQGSVVEAAPGPHSAKPHVFRERVEKVGYPPRLELFGRETFDGWVVWGNEVKRGLFHQAVEEIAA